MLTLTNTPTQHPVATCRALQAAEGYVFVSLHRDALRELDSISEHEQDDCDVLIAPMGAAAKTTGKAGAPVVAIPCGLDKNGVPFGITVFAKVGSDARVLAVAGAIERAVGERRLPKV